MNVSDARKAHKILDDLLKGNIVLDEEREFLRNALPELPKQKTLKELYSEVYDVWVVTDGNEWPDDVYGDLETWLQEQHRQLRGLTLAKPAHPVFLETEEDYQNAPEGTIVARSGQIPWVKESRKQWSCISDDVVNCSMAQSKPRQILRWGWGE